MRIRVKNFQSLADVELEAEGLTVIVGSSNIGKSALIRAVSSALYGRPGHDFVRLGENYAEVQLDDVPSVSSSGSPLEVVWTKGSGHNRFRVNGVALDKVGTEIPTNIQAGYRDIRVNDEYIRPQVSYQFDRLFLLDRPGSFANEVISQATRLNVLLKADKSCATDLKRQSSLLRIRKSDLLRSTSALENLSDIPVFRDRVQFLSRHVADLKLLNRRLEDIHYFSEKRKKLKVLIATPQPVRVDLPPDLGRKASEASSLVSQRQKLRDLISIEPPKPDLTAIDVGSKLVTVRELLSNRNTAIELSKTPLPKEFIPAALVPMDWSVKTVLELRELIQLREQYIRQEYDARMAVAGIEGEQEEVQAELDTILSSLDTCPVCNRPMEKIEV